MINKKEIISFSNNQEWLDKKFIELCQTGDLDTIRYMLISSDLKIKPNFSGPEDYSDDYDYDGITTAAANGHLHIVDYLLFSPELENHDYFPNFVFDYLRLICDGGHFHIADFLVEKKVFNPIYVFTEVHYNDNEPDALTHYLVLNCDIEKVPAVQDIINKSPDIAKIFETRELNKELHKELETKDKPNKKIKL